jgi:hypothetical protein
LQTLGVFPPQSNPNAYAEWMLALALSYRTLYTILGGCITAMLAPEKPMGHVVALGVIGIIAGTLGAIVGWNLGDHWYPVALALLAFPSVWLGGKLRKKIGFSVNS